MYNLHVTVNSDPEPAAGVAGVNRPLPQHQQLPHCLQGCTKKASKRLRLKSTCTFMPPSLLSIPHIAEKWLRGWCRVWPLGSQLLACPAPPLTCYDFRQVIVTSTSSLISKQKPKNGDDHSTPFEVLWWEQNGICEELSTNCGCCFSRNLQSSSWKDTSLGAHETCTLEEP